MQLRELEIERFGVWQDVTFPFHERGLTVLYGPNEAGKSTLMRFIRGVLYGYRAPEDRIPGQSPRPQRWAGSLKVTHQGQPYRLRRLAEGGARGQLEINDQSVRDDDPLLTRLVGKTPESVFQNIFAIGLHELQQLATLNGEEVAQHLYGLSLGPEGEQIFRAHRGLEAAQSKVLGHEGHAGAMPGLLAQLRQVDRELARLGSVTEKHSQLQTRVRNAEDEVADLKQRQADIHHELRGHQFLTRISEPWRRERELQRQLKRLPVDDLDREILARFDELELELSQVGDQRKAFIEEARTLQAQSEAIVTRPELEQQACAVQNLFEKTRSMQSLERTQAGNGKSPQPTRRQDFAGQIAQACPGWDERKLAQADLSPGQWMKLSTLAEACRSASRLRKRLIKKKSRLAKSFRALQQRVPAALTELAQQSPTETRLALQRRLEELEELRALKFRREHLLKALELFRRDREQQVVVRDLPPFFLLILWFFVFAGIVLVGAGAYAAIHGYEGLVAGRATAWIAGGCFTLLGLAAICTSWTMKDYFQTIEFRSPHHHDEVNELEHELRRSEQAIERLQRRELTGALGVSLLKRLRHDAGEDEQIAELRRQLLELDRHESRCLRVDRVRRRLSLLRMALQERQKQFGRARREWTDALKRLGFNESLKIRPAFEQLQRLTELQRQLRDGAALHEREELQRQELQQFYGQLDELAKKIEGDGFVIRDRFGLLAEWQRDLSVLAERRRERSRLRQLAKEKRQAAQQLVERIERMREQRSALLQRLGMADRGEIALKLAALDERATLEHQLREIHAEIAALAAEEPDLAITEDDLARYDERHNNETILDLRRELKELDGQLQQHFESLGTLRHTLRELECDRTVTSLRFDREQLMHEIRNQSETWLAARTADQMVHQLRQKIERERQPETLQAASSILQRLTCGKYRKIWTPLGEKLLLVDDDQGQSLRMEQLSSGTREQVFLAVRLAMIRDFARQGVELPLVLDDVTVNFDQGRTEAAVQTLLSLAEQGQQVLLFTCHLHLARMFENQGIEPIWLPKSRSEASLSA